MWFGNAFEHADYLKALPEYCILLAGVDIECILLPHPLSGRSPQINSHLVGKHGNHKGNEFCFVIPSWL